MVTCPFCGRHELTGSELQEHIKHKHPEETIETVGPNRIQRKKFKRREKGDPIIVDGDSIATCDGAIKVINIKKARSFLKNEGFDPTIYISTNLKKNMDNSMEITRMINLGWVNEIPNKKEMNKTTVDEAKSKNCKIMSNSDYGAFLKQYSRSEWDLEAQIMKFQLENGKFKFI